MGTCYLVIGTPRSGTNCVAGVIQRLGVFMGERFFEADEMQPAGFHQDLDFEDACDPLFPGVFQPPFPYVLLASPQPIIGLIRKREAMGVDWGVKLSHGAILAPIFAEHCNDLRIIETRRDTGASVRSMAMYTIEGEQPAEVIANAQAAVDATREIKVPRLVVDYSDLVASPTTGVPRIAGFIGRPVTPEAVAFVDSKHNRCG